MTAEEYLNEHCKPEDWNNLEESLKDSILTNNVIEYMERYATLRIHDVVGKSEPLVCDTCKSGLIDYLDINRRTCRCGGLGYNVTD